MFCQGSDCFGEGEEERESAAGEVDIQSLLRRIGYVDRRGWQGVF